MAPTTWDRPSLTSGRSHDPSGGRSGLAGRAVPVLAVPPPLLLGPLAAPAEELLVGLGIDRGGATVSVVLRDGGRPKANVLSSAGAFLERRADAGVGVTRIV
jgi:hypothetical protein